MELIELSGSFAIYRIGCVEFIFQLKYDTFGYFCFYEPCKKF